MQVWACVAAIDVSLVLVSTSIIVWVAPAASGSGIPEVIGFLNGASLRKIFNIRAWLCVLILAVQELVGHHYWQK